MAKPSGVSKFFKTLLIILLVLIMAITIGINVLFMKPSSAPFNNSIYIMQQTDMNDVQYGDAVISSAEKVAELQPGNVVLCLTSFDNERKEVLKLIDITQEDGTTYYYVKSDNETVEDALKLTEDKILAKCLWTNPELGMVLNFVKSTMGVLILIGVPCVILLIMAIASTISKKKEIKEEEEIIKKSKSRKKSNDSQHTKNNEKSNDSQHTKNNEKSKTNSEDFFNDTSNDENNNKKDNTSHNKSVNKPIAVKQLSEEQSIKQREDVSKMVGSELKKTTTSKTMTFNNNNVKVSPNHVPAYKIEEDAPNPNFDEDVHSPNMNEKADKIRKALSDKPIDDNETKPVVAQISNKSIETPKPTQPTTNDDNSNVNETPKPIIVPTEPKQDMAKEVESAVVIIPESTPKPKTVKVITNNNSDNTNDDFLKDIIGEDDIKTSKNNTISDDILDQLLNSIPSNQKTSTTIKTTSTPSSVTKTTPRKTTTNTKTHTTKTVKHHRTTNKAVDNTSFDELIKAIEKEKNGIK